MNNCIGCKCNVCAYNVNIGTQYFTPGEVDERCFNCDDCMSTKYGGLWMGECTQYRKPVKKADMETRIGRSRLKLL